jgi:hypothetical protein
MEAFFLVFWGVLVSHSLVCSVPGGDCCFFSLPSFLLFLFLLFGSVEPQGVCWDICGLVSLATPQYKHVYTNHTVRTSRPVPTLTIRYVIRLISGSSVRAGVLYLQHKGVQVINWSVVRNRVVLQILTVKSGAACRWVLTRLFVIIWLQLAIPELEDLLLSPPDIDDAAVIGVYNSDEVTEVPKAYGKHAERHAFAFFDIEAS